MTHSSEEGENSVVYTRDHRRSEDWRGQYQALLNAKKDLSVRGVIFSLLGTTSIGKKEYDTKAWGIHIECIVSLLPE